MAASATSSVFTLPMMVNPKGIGMPSKGDLGEFSAQDVHGGVFQAVVTPGAGDGFQIKDGIAH